MDYQLTGFALHVDRIMNEQSRKSMSNSSAVESKNSTSSDFSWPKVDKRGAYDSSGISQEFRRLGANELELIEEFDQSKLKGSTLGNEDQVKSVDHDWNRTGMNPYDSDGVIKTKVPGYSHPAMVSKMVANRKIDHSLVTKYGHTKKKKSGLLASLLSMLGLTEKK
jgi:hypothetical protein